MPADRMQIIQFGEETDTIVLTRVVWMTALARGQGVGHGGRFQLCAGSGARARWSWARERMPSLRKTLFRW